MFFLGPAETGLETGLEMTRELISIAGMPEVRHRRHRIPRPCPPMQHEARLAGFHRALDE